MMYSLMPNLYELSLIRREALNDTIAPTMGPFGAEA
jgi:hypothetical protein